MQQETLEIIATTNAGIGTVMLIIGIKVSNYLNGINKKIELIAQRFDDHDRRITRLEDKD